MSIRLENVDLGTKIIQVPVARIEGKSGGPTLLITAGNDGDEYAGIKAAYALIEQFQHKAFTGSLIIIPIVNIPGFEHEISRNPIDFLFPKYIYPGSPSGKPTERLRNWLSTYVKQSQFWLDLHDGALTERLSPFIYACKSGLETVDIKVERVIKYVQVNYAAYISPWDSIKLMAKSGCGYMIVESAAYGKANAETVRRHVECTQIVMQTMNMLSGSLTRYPKIVFRGVHEYVVKKSGIWEQSFSSGNTVKKGNLLGEVRSIDGNILERVVVKENGVMLWGKDGLRASAGDVIAGVGFNEQTIETI